jgi:hypothetical protein
MVTQCWNDVYRLYPRWFEPCVAVQMPCASASAASGSAVVKATEVASRGMACVIDVRKLAAGQSLRASSGEGGELVLDVVSPRQAISADPEAERLMEQYDCDIAVSSSTLVTLFDSDTSGRFAHVVSRRQRKRPVCDCRALTGELSMSTASQLGNPDEKQSDHTQWCVQETGFLGSPTTR